LANQKDRTDRKLALRERRDMLCFFRDIKFAGAAPRAWRAYVGWKQVLIGLAVALAASSAASKAFALDPIPVAATAATAQGVNVAVEVAADSPRQSVTRFLEATGAGRFNDASIYLELQGKEPQRAAELARRLDAVLKRRIWLEPETLSPFSRGTKDLGAALVNPGPPATPVVPLELGRIKDKRERAHPVRLIRREAQGKDDEARWVFAHDSVAYIDEWYEALEDRWVRERMPAVLLREGPRSLMWWQWLAIPVFTTAAWLVGRLLAGISKYVLKRLASRTKTSWDKHLVAEIGGPLTLGWAGGVLMLARPQLALYEPADNFLNRVLKSVLLVALFWTLIRAARAGAEVAKDASWGKGRRSLETLSGMAVRVSRFVLFALGSVAVLSELGYPVASLLAGFGLGGIAVALAAQKTMEHLFGSIAILADQPFRVGEVVKVDGVVGTVEQIGLRSTRLRTEERSIVIIPNGKLADMRIENLAQRDRFWFSCEVEIAALTPLANRDELLSAYRKASTELDLVVVGTADAQLKALRDGALRIEFSAYIQTTESVVFQRVRGALLALIVRILAEQGIVPLRLPVTAGQPATAVPTP
jgi:MscS family membrane protein